MSYTATGPAPVSGIFPAGGPLHLLEIRIQAIQLSPYHAGPPAPRPVRLGTTTGFLACYCPHRPFGSRLAIRPRDIPPNPSLLDRGYSRAPRGAEHAGRARCPCPVFPPPAWRLSTTKTRRNAEHAPPTTTAPNTDTTDSPRSLLPSRRQPVRTAQGPPPSITDPATLLERATVLAKHIRVIVNSFPPLTPEQRDRIATLLHTPGNRRGDPA